MEKVRDSIVDGLFYPGERETLKKTVAGLLGKAVVPFTDAQAIITPHAGYDYAGMHIAHAFKAASDRFIRTIVLLGPVHRDPEKAISLSESAFFSTPVGSTAVDSSLVEALTEGSTTMIQNDIPHLEEHCLEIQLPFIQYLFPEATIVPILMGLPSQGNIRALSQALDVVFNETIDTTLFVISTNASPHTKPGAVEHYADSFIASIVSGADDRSVKACGFGCAVAVLSMKSVCMKPFLLSRGVSEVDKGAPKRTVAYVSIGMKKETGDE